MVSVLHKGLEDLEYNVESLTNKKLEVMQTKLPNFPLVNKPSRISPHKVLQS